MNCQDIALILDDGDVTQLEAAVARTVDAHLRSCPDCARDWQIHGRLVRKALPQMPADLLSSCAALVRGPSSRRTQPSRHFVIIGALALAAAAALWVSSHRPVPPAPDLEPVASVFSQVSVPAILEPEPPRAVEKVAVRDANDEAPAGPTASFSIWLLPLDAGTDDAAVGSVARELHERILEELRALPGASVSEGELIRGRRPDYIVQVSKATLPSVTDPKDMWRFQVTVQVPRSSRSREQVAAYDEARAFRKDPVALVDGYVQPFSTSSLLSLKAPCEMRLCPDAQATQVVSSLRLNAFRHDAAKQQELFARFVEPGTDFATRRRLLDDLHSLMATGRATPVDARFMRVILEMHASAPDRAQRLALWRALAHSSDSALVEPLISLVGQESDVQVRAMLVTRLVTNFNEDARARSALSEISASDASELVRQVAVRGAGGDEAWHQYVVATIKDRSLAPQQRWEPVEYLMDQGMAVQEGLALRNQSLDRLDTEALAALADLLPRVWAEQRLENDFGHSIRFQNLLNRVKDPALAGLLLQSLDGGSPFTRITIVGLLGNYIDDAQVAEALEGLQENDSDPKVREAATRALARRKTPVEASASDQ